MNKKIRYALFVSVVAFQCAVTSASSSHEIRRSHSYVFHFMRVDSLPSQLIQDSLHLSSQQMQQVQAINNRFKKSSDSLNIITGLDSLMRSQLKDELRMVQLVSLQRYLGTATYLKYMPLAVQ